MQQNLFNWSANTWEVLDQLGILAGLVVSIFSLILTLVALFAYFNKERIKNWLTQNRFPHIGEMTDDETQWDGLIFSISHADTPKWVIESRKPTIIGLLATQQSKASAEEVRQSALAQGVKVLDTIYIDNPDDIKEVQQEALHLISRLQQQSCEHIAVDITGGKTPMSLGAFIAAEEARVTSLYVSSEFDAKLKQVDMRTTKLITVSSAGY